ncbi:hypothetical protein N5079_31985 [Planotetraspora sp. A-T 1434]|uniref:hypothetical protein n=1 Tax=Planotetraspora sp. A-T 1434 TaxID=2979219 RepID=UPI0021BF3BFE|nr:hypothetical protein [Planotetraspora sp. A-T 1434]MCT9934836.1 hypothetical protein [Planotetraspora sp. A-T 1434]
MTTARALTGLAIAAALVTIAPAAAQAATGTPDSASAASSASAPKLWGPYYAPAKKAKASGKISVTGLDTSAIPAVGTAYISGKVTDYTKSTATCGWAVFRITYRKPDGNLPFTHKSYLACGTTKPTSFSFSYKNVYEVELKVCSEGKAAKPSLNCLYAGTWKVLYVSH